MAKTYDKYTHTHATFRVGGDGRQTPPLPIVLYCGGFVFLAADYGLEYAPDKEVVRVGDGRCRGYDDDGNCVLSVPAGRCAFWTDEEAECIERSTEADELLLSYARG